MGKELFIKGKTCSRCGCLLPDDYRFDFCAKCEDADLFEQVKEYIRTNDVTETQVARHFNISLRKVRAWIKEGRIQYRDNGKPSFDQIHCKKCDRPILFGEYCETCMRSGGGSIYFDVRN